MSTSFNYQFSATRIDNIVARNVFTVFWTISSDEISLSSVVANLGRHEEQLMNTGLSSPMELFMQKLRVA